MPRVSAAHEQEVRDRILSAAARVFSQKGYHSSTIARRRPRERPVGRGHLQPLLGQGRAVPADLRPTRDARPRRARRTGSRPRAPPPSGWRSRSRCTSRRSTTTTATPGQVSLVQAWAEADREPGVREMLAAPSRAPRRGRPAPPAPGRRSPASCPAGLDVDAVTRGLLALLDGLLLQRIEAGAAYRPADLERRAGAHPRAPARGRGSHRGRTSRSPCRRRSIARHGPRPDRPRPDRPDRPRVHPAARAHADRAVAHPVALGLLAAHPRRAGHPRGARAGSARPAGGASST